MTSTFLRILPIGLAAACLLHVGIAHADASPIPDCSDPCTVDECSDRGVECALDTSDLDETIEDSDAEWQRRGAAYEKCQEDADARGWEQECSGDHGEDLVVYCEPSSGCAMSRKNERGIWGALVFFGTGVGITLYRARRLGRPSA